MAEAALAGVRVVDLSQGIAGPYCTKLLADLGAEVIKVEPPAGDYTRRLGPFPGDAPDPEKSGLFIHLNGNKKSVVLDIDTDDGRAALGKLLANADVLVESEMPGRMAELGPALQRPARRLPEPHLLLGDAVRADGAVREVQGQLAGGDGAVRPDVHHRRPRQGAALHRRRAGRLLRRAARVGGDPRGAGAPRGDRRRPAHRRLVPGGAGLARTSTTRRCTPTSARSASASTPATTSRPTPARSSPAATATSSSSAARPASR